MMKTATWQLLIERRGSRWLGTVAGLDEEFRGLSIEGVIRRARQTLGDLFDQDPDHISLHILFAQDDLAQLATQAAAVRNEVELAIAQQKQRERRELARLAKVVDSTYQLSNRDIGAIFGVHHRTVGQLMNQS